METKLRALCKNGIMTVPSEVVCIEDGMVLRFDCDRCPHGPVCEFKGSVRVLKIEEK
jgi:hypothetical protein